MDSVLSEKDISIFAIKQIQKKNLKLQKFDFFLLDLYLIFAN